LPLFFLIWGCCFCCWWWCDCCLSPDL
jgi:hypothetical protein